jgi:uncharacterized protein YecE (DUF72 family)
MTPAIRIATAGWQIPREQKTLFPDSGSILHRYAQVLDAVEINSSFYRPHRQTTYARWATDVPRHFRFSVKMPRSITHQAAFSECLPALTRFLEEIAGLGEKLGAVLMQTPGSQEFRSRTVGEFLDGLRNRFAGMVVCEPRHASWFTGEADGVLRDHRVARVAADPARVPEAAHTGAWPGLAYFRLHGSPEIYATSYDDGRLGPLCVRLREQAGTAETWCVFDNTKHGHAISDALSTVASLAAYRPT